jgi:glycosyltransferase involved in cell wall biosynthesis
MRRFSYSVVIPCYNSRDTVGRAIESALFQTIPPLEIIVVDDGSTDDPAGVVSGYSRPVRLIRQANAGPGAARNRGVRETSGDWVAFLDADDTWLPEKTERQCGLMEEPGIGVVHARGPEARNPAPLRVALDLLWDRNCITLSSAIVRRSAFDSVKGFDERTSLIGVEDHNLWLRLVAAGWAIATYPEELIRYNSTESSLSRQLERFARANIANMRIAGEILAVGPETVARKIRETRLNAGLGLIHVRDMRTARRFFSEDLRERLSLPALLLWLLTFAPTSLLELRRKCFGFLRYSR